MTHVLKTLMRGRRSGFTLIELIGVMAIMAIMAGVLVPNVLKSIERAAIRAEETNLRALGDTVKLYLRDNGALPTTAVPPAATNWTTQLAVYSSLPAAEIWTNKRQSNRMLVVHAPSQRAMLISGMRTGVGLPTVANVTASFAGVWDWSPTQLPFTVPPGTGWGAWNIDNIDHLVIERVALASVYRTEVVSYTVILNNKSVVPASRTVSYRIVNSNGTTKEQNILAPKPATTWQRTVVLGPKERLDLFSQGTYGVLDYSCVGVSRQMTFDYTDTHGWRAL